MAAYEIQIFYLCREGASVGQVVVRQIWFECFFFLKKLDFILSCSEVIIGLTLESKVSWNECAIGVGLIKHGILAVT